MERLGSGPVVSPEMSLLPRAVGGLLWSRPAPGVSLCCPGWWGRRASARWILPPGVSRPWPTGTRWWIPSTASNFPAGPATPGAYAILVAQCVRDHWDKPLDAVTWTPLSRQRRRERGYDQAQLLAKWTARELELPVLGMLDKVRDIPPQSGIQDDARRRPTCWGRTACARMPDQRA